VIAQDQDVAMTEIGEEACSFLRVSARALVVVIGDVANHMKGMLVKRQQPIPLHRDQGK
jgi:hypothetical protein